MTFPSRSPCSISRRVSGRYPPRYPRIRSSPGSPFSKRSFKVRVRTSTLRRLVAKIKVWIPCFRKGAARCRAEVRALFRIPSSRLITGGL